MKILKLIRSRILGIGVAGVMGFGSLAAPFSAFAADTEENVSENEAVNEASDEVSDEAASEEESKEGGSAEKKEKNSDENVEEDNKEEAEGSSEEETVSENGSASGDEDVSENDGELPIDTCFPGEPGYPSEPETPVEPEKPVTPPAPAVYTGITIDGELSDWDAVPKNGAAGMIQEAAVVQDGDYVYIYLKDDGNECAAWSGPKNNGKFSFVSDLGYTTTFQLNNNPASISGVEGASCAYKFSWDNPGSGEWEVAVPVSALPVNMGSYSFGFYQGDRFVEGITDDRYQPVDPGKGDEGENKPFDGIVYDGLYGDWRNYPHTLIHYATSGTEERVVDGEGALYVDGSTLYGHCITIMNRHLNNEGGNEMLEGVVLRINGRDDMLFEFRFATVDGAGNINWHPQLEYLSEGTYEYIITDVNGWGNAANIEELKNQGVDKDGYYGRILVSVDSVTDECEWWLDLPLLAERFGLDETDIKTIEVKYEQIGDRWLETAGASSGAVAGIMLSLSAVGAVLVLRKKKGERGQCTI